ncbi:MAG: hypothetical protein Q8936_24195 [Bacillota bacterium]|nr:hypothetical protein [Bacillota bacterium]
MKYYEFGNNFEMYALIGANTMNEAMDAYTEHIYEDMDGELPIEVTEEYALDKLLNAFDVCDTEEEKQKAREEFKMCSEESEPYLILIDADLDY